MANKIRVIYLPFLLIAVSCVAGYSFLNWLLIIKGGFTGLSEEVVNIWLPYAVPWAPMFLWLRPRLKALNLSGRQGNRPFVFCMIGAMAIAAPTIVSQFYLETATGIKSNLTRIGQINEVAETKYYTVSDIYFYKTDVSEATSTKVVGRYNEDLVLAFYLVCPVGDSARLSDATSNCWIGIVYKKTISNRLSNEEKATQLSAFIKASEENYWESNLKDFTYLERIGISDDRKGLVEAAKRNLSFKPDTPITVLIVHHDNFSERNGNKLPWIFGSFGIGSFIWFLMLGFAPVDHAEMARLLRGEKPKAVPLRFLFIVFIPQRSCFVTPILIDANIVVFAIMVLSGLGFTSFSAQDLFVWGGTLRSAVLDGQVWRLFTSMFIHGGVIHLLGNMFCLIWVGTLLEPVFGRLRFIICYVASGVASGVASIYWHTATVSIGASGAIFGLMGGVIGYSIWNGAKESLSKKHVLGVICSFIGYNFLLGLAGVGIDNAGHVGGLACGIVIGVLFHLFPSVLPRRP